MNFQSRLAGLYNEPVELDGDEEALRKRKRIIIIAAVLALVLLAAAFYFFGGSEKESLSTGTEKKQAPRITVIIPGKQIVEGAVTATGSLAARREMPVSVVGEGGMVARVLVEPGTWVQAGQVLAVIERSVQVQQSAQLAAQINAAQADARLTQSELERAQALVSRGFISKADIERKTALRDAALARVRVAQAQFGENSARIGRLDIRAPAAGLVLTRSVEPGQVVSSGSGILFRLARGGEMELRAQLSEADLARMSVGLSAKVTPVGADRSVTGQIWQISPVIDPQSRQGVARIALAYDPLLRPGGFAAATIVSGTTEAPLLPEFAVHSDDKGSYAFVVDANNKVLRRDIRIGAVTDKGVSIMEGLTGSEKVVLTAGAFLNAGEAVEPALLKRTN